MTRVRKKIHEICKLHDNQPDRLLDIAIAVQREFLCVDAVAMDVLAKELSIPRADVEGLVSFYAFLSQRPTGKVVIRLCDDVIDRLHGFDVVARVFEDELGIEMGETTADGAITLSTTSCIGMSDQAPAALIGDVVVTELNSDKARQIVTELRSHMDPSRLVKKLGDGMNAHDLVQAMVNNNIRRAGAVVFSPVNRGEAIRKALSVSPVEVIRAVKTARLRGRGGAGFPTGMKWEFVRAAEGERKFIICNADEGEPGTFKDRVILTERPDRMFAGMVIAGYAVGAKEGILYLRAEYAYLREYLEHVLARRREDHLLGKDITGAKGFDFDIRIQMGGGAYICGEESALIESCEGKRGDPRNRPPFPAQHGYLGCPTAVNNVETLAKVAKILEEGPATFALCGSENSTGTKLLSISGDCTRPGVYELPFGIAMKEVLRLAGGEGAAAVQVGGPSGQMIDPSQYDRAICFDDLATGGSIMVFGGHRDVVEIARAFTEFFEEESCGYCTPCRVGCTLLRKGLDRILTGKGEPADLEQLEQIGASMSTASRCGLGQTASNPVITSLRSFPAAYQERVSDVGNGYRRAFDLGEALQLAESIAGRESIHRQAQQEGGA